MPAKRKLTENSNADKQNDTYEYNSFMDFRRDITFGSMASVLLDYESNNLKNIIQNPMDNIEEVYKISRLIYNSNGISTNTIDYMVALPTLDKVVVIHGNKSKTKAENYKELTYSVLRKMKDKEFIRDALFRDMIDGICFYYFETTTSKMFESKTLSDFEMENITEINELGVNVSVISLPVEYTQIKGIKNSSPVIAFNLEYFKNLEGESIENKLKKYPKEIRDGYYNYINKEGSNNWLVLDNSKTIVHKIRSAKHEKWGRPLVLAAINNILYSDYFTETKRNVLNEVNNKIIYQTFPEGEKGKSTLTEPQQKRQHETVRDAVMNKNTRGGISFFSVAAGSKINNVTVDTTIFDEKNEAALQDNIAMDLGFGSSLLNASSSGNYSTQQNNLQLVMSEIFQWIEGITFELNKVINANIIKDKSYEIEVYYLPISLINRNETFGYMKDLYTQGSGSLQALIASSGMNVDVYLSLMNKEREEKWDEKYPPHQTSYTVSDSADKTNPSGNIGGRPETANPTNENTLKSKNSGSNKQKKPSTK